MQEITITEFFRVTSVAAFQQPVFFHKIYTAEMLIVQLCIMIYDKCPS